MGKTQRIFNAGALRDEGAYRLSKPQILSNLSVQQLEILRQTSLTATPTSGSGFKRFCSCRWTTAYTSCIVLLFSLIMRHSMSMAVVCMRSRSSIRDKIQANESIESVTMTPNDTVDIKTGTTYMDGYSTWSMNWNSIEVGLVLSAYQYGFPILPVFGGFLASRFGAKMTVAIVTIIQTASFLAIPFVTQQSYGAVVGLRVVCGLAASCVIPALTQLCPHGHHSQRGHKLLAISYTGINMSNMVAFSLSGFICSIPVYGGWPFIFFIFGGCSLLTLVLWLSLVYNSPSEHPRISEEEHAYITSNILNTDVKNIKTPWKKILTSLPVWALLVAHCCIVFVNMIFTTYLPIYMEDVLKFGIEMNGVLSSVPFVGRTLGSLFFAFIADHVISRGSFSTTITRKVFQSGGNISSSALSSAFFPERLFLYATGFTVPILIGIGFLDDSQRTLAVVLMVLFWTVQSASNSGFRINHLDIAPRYAGVVTGLTLSAASVAGIVSPIITSAITNNGTSDEWRIVFLMCAGVSLFGSVVYAIFGSGKEQGWSKSSSRNTSFEVSRKSSVNVLHDSSRRSSVYSVHDGGSRQSSAYSMHVNDASSGPQSGEDENGRKQSVNGLLELENKAFTLDDERHNAQCREMTSKM